MLQCHPALLQPVLHRLEAHFDAVKESLVISIAIQLLADVLVEVLPVRCNTARESKPWSECPGPMNQSNAKLAAGGNGNFKRSAEKIIHAVRISCFYAVRTRLYLQ